VSAHARTLNSPPLKKNKNKKNGRQPQKKKKKKLVLEFSEMARTFIEKFLGQPLLGEK
jgi:hypothetical protein